MNHSRASRAFGFSRPGSGVGLVALGAMLAACQSILGIEDLHTEPRDPGKGGMDQAGNGAGGRGGTAGSTSNGGSAGSSAARGGTGGSTGGSAGAGARGGSSNGGDAGNSASGTGGMGGTAGNGTGGSSGVGGTSSGSGGEGGMPPEGGPITGKLIDFWRHPVPNVAIYVGDATATTDADGTFTIPDVPATYDAACVIELDNPVKVYEWAFLGLTRRDPTLQVNEGLNSYEAHFYVTPEASGMTFNDDQWLLGIGSEDGADFAHAGPGGFDRRPYWWGPATSDWTLHSLFLERMGDLPSKYLAYETKTATTDGTMLTMQQDFTMDLTPGELDDGNITGAIVEDTGVGRANSVFIRFASGAPMALVDRVATSASSYQYLVPSSLPNATITIAASETHDDDSYSIAHRNNRGAGDTGVDIVIPPPVSGLMPADETTGVGPDTVLSFNQGDPANSGYLIHIESESNQQGLYIVTAERQVRLGDVPILHDVIVPGVWHNWTVETHGQFASVDDMAGSNGFLDIFAANNYRPWGPSHRDGAFTSSYMTDFQTAP